MFFMKRIVRVYLILWFVLSGFSLSAANAGQQSPEIDGILNSAESLFKTMKAREYSRIWVYLSEASKKEIVNVSYKAIRKYNAAAGMNVEYPRELVESDFRSGGAAAQSYWDGYLTSFIPEVALEQSRWEMGSIGRNEAELLLWYKRSELPARIQMFKENGEWKVGLIETFKYSKR